MKFSLHSGGVRPTVVLRGQSGRDVRASVAAEVPQLAIVGCQSKGTECSTIRQEQKRLMELSVLQSCLLAWAAFQG